MKSSFTAWLTAVALIVLTGAYLHLMRESYHAGTPHIGGLPVKMGNWECREIPSRELNYTDPSMDVVWTGVCINREVTSLNVYIGYAAQQRKGKRTASPRTNSHAGDPRWSYSYSRDVEIFFAGKTMPPIHANETLLSHSNGKNLGIVYWYQMGKNSFSSDYRYRLALLMRKLWERKTNAAVIRISASVDKGGAEEFFRAEKELAREIYPVILEILFRQ